MSCHLLLRWETQQAFKLSPLKGTEGYRRVSSQYFFCGKSTIKSASVRGQHKEPDSDICQGICLAECSVRKRYVQLYSVLSLPETQIQATIAEFLAETMNQKTFYCCLIIQSKNKVIRGKKPNLYLYTPRIWVSSSLNLIHM